MAGETYVLEMIVFDKGDEEAKDGVRARFDEARDVAQGWRTEGMYAQWWGQAFEKPNAYFWYLQWRSPAHYTASLPSPLRAHLFSLLPPSPSTTPAPTTNPASPAPTTSTPLLLPTSPDTLLRAPILEMTRFWVHDDVPTERMVAVLAGFHAEMERLREEAALGRGVGMVGSRGWTGGFALDLKEGQGQGEEGTKVGKEGAHVAGWESVEDHMKLGEGDERFLAAFEDTAKVVRRLEIWHMKVVPHP